MYIIVGLGNPGEEYENTRHNTGRMTVESFCVAEKFGEFSFDKKINSLKAEGKIGKEKVLCLLPETFMNKSGSALKGLIKSAKAAKQLVVIHDDLDLPLGRLKLSFSKSSAGHKGVESVMRAIKTKDFWRLRVGISPATPKGNMKKPKGEKVVLNFLMGKFKTAEMAVLKKNIKNIVLALRGIIPGGRIK